MIRVFLCHASIDKPKVRRLYTYLRKQGVDAWLDEKNLLAGQDWKSEIPKALAESDAIIICLSQTSIDKEGYIQKEIRFALDKALEIPDGKIFLIPARLEECKVPNKLSAYQWVDLFEKNGYSKLMRSLKAREGEILKRVSLSSVSLTDSVGIDSFEKEMPGVHQTGSELSDNNFDADIVSTAQNEDSLNLDRLDLSSLTYQIKTEIGRGINGVVYRCEHKILKKSAAIKFFHPSVMTNSSRLSKVIKTINIVSGSSHPNLISIYSLDTNNFFIAVTMEYVADGNLRSWASKQPRSIHEKLSVLEQVAEALDVLHKQKSDDGDILLHLNLTPENILLEYDSVSEKYRVLLTDLGLYPDSVLEAGNIIIPYFFYISPEQVENVSKNSLDGRSDQYSLAAIAYELFCNRLPFESKDAIALTIKRLDDLPDAPSSINQDLPIEFNDVLLRALSKFPENRYSSCVDFTRKLNEALESSKLRKTRELVEEAWDAINKKDLQKAQIYLDQANMINPDDLRVLDAVKVLDRKSKLENKYLDMANNWKNAQQKASMALDLVKDFSDPKNLFLNFGLRKQKEKITIEHWTIQVFAGLLAAAPIVVLIIYIVFGWIVRE